MNEEEKQALWLIGKQRMRLKWAQLKCRNCLKRKGREGKLSGPPSTPRLNDRDIEKSHVRNGNYSHQNKGK